MISFSEIQKWQKDWHIDEADEEAWKHRKILLESTSYDQKADFARAIQHVRDQREQLIYRFAYGFADQMALDSSVGTTPHLQRLLELALKTGVGQKQRWFEAMSLFDQTISVSKIEQKFPIDLLGQHLDSFIDLIADQLFDQGFRSHDFYVYHDPQNEYEVSKEDVGIDKHLTRPKLIRRKSRLTCRYHNDGNYAFIEHRIKKAFQAWIKVQRQIHEENQQRFEINDRIGLMFVVKDYEDARNLIERISGLLKQREVFVIEPLSGNFFHDTHADTKNSNSSAKYKVAKFVIKWKEQTLELQFMTFWNYFSSKRALSSVNHELYKLRQHMNFTFPLLWPKEIYGLDWENPAIRHQLHSWKVSQLGWRVNGDSHET